MKRPLFLAATGLAAVLACASSATATHSDGTGPKHELVAGTGTLVVPQPFRQDPMLHVNAQRDKETGESRGHFYVRYPETETQAALDFRGDVVCLDVSLNNATIIGEIERRRPASAVGETAFLEGTLIQIRITDNGEPGTLDGANFDYPSPFQTCTAQLGNLPITQGNYIAHDDPPLELLSGLDLLLAEFEAAAGDH